MSLKDQLDEISWKNQNVFEELNAFRTVTPLVDLLPTSASLRNSASHWTNEILLETILSKSDELPDAQRLTSVEAQEHAISLAKSLVIQRKYWQASLILKGMCTGPDFLNLRSDHKIKLLKLHLLVDVGEDFEKPRRVANIEGSCKVLLAKETSEEEKPSLGCPCPGNLIGAYLFRLHGVKGRDVDPFAESTIAATLKKQMSLAKPSLSAVWATQQYVRLCLRNGEFGAAEKVLNLVQKALVAIGRKDGPEADLNTHLYETLQSSHSRGNSTPPELFEVYDKHPVDFTWLKSLRLYVEDEPHTCPDEIRRTRNMDSEYWR